MLSAGPTTQLRVYGPIARSDLPGLYRRGCATLEACQDRVLMCDVSRLPADAVAVDALARLALGARRQGCEVLLRGATAELRALVELMGMGQVLLSE